MTDYLYTAAEIRSIEQLVISEYLNNDSMELMQRAAKAACRIMQEKFPEAKKLLVCCGKGNNAADAMYLAINALASGISSQILLLSEESELTDVAKGALDDCRSKGMVISKFAADASYDADLLVDGLIGIGLNGSLKSDCYDFIQWVNKCEIPKLAIDVPSGLQSDTGLAMEDCVHADVTATFVAYKRGLFTHQGSHFSGEIILDSLNVPDEAFAQVESGAKLMSASSGYLSSRQKDAHKGDFGHVLIVGGDYGMGGAVRVAAEAALRAGAGLVTVATRPEHVCVVSSQRPEIMCHQVTEASDIQSLLEKATVIVIGPGLGKEQWGRDLFAEVMQSDLPKVLDADALNILSESPVQSDNWILTPHPGEAARLLNTFGQAVQQDRFKSAAALCKKYGGVSVLKGAGTIVAAPNNKMEVCPFGNPGMASGGMGDLLSGLIGGLLAQGIPAAEAAVKGVLVHAQAADIAAQAGGGERGLLAMDLLVNIRSLINPACIAN